MAISLSAGLLVLAAPYALAQSTELLVQFPGATTTDTPPGEYIKAIYQWSIGLAALLAMGMLVFGGFKYTLSAGSVGSQDSAKSTIKNALLGLVLLLGAVLILTTINPSLSTLDIGLDSARIRQGKQLLAEEGARLNVQAAFLNSYKEAGEAARGRLFGIGLEAYNKMKAETDIYVSGDGNDIVDIVGPETGDDDLHEYMAEALDDKNSEAVRRGYRDAVIAAIYYNAQNLNSKDFAILLKRIRGHEDFKAVKGTDYLSADPWGLVKEGVPPVGKEIEGSGQALFVERYRPVYTAAMGRLSVSPSTVEAEAAKDLLVLRQRILKHRDYPDDPIASLGALLGPSPLGFDLLELMQTAASRDIPVAEWRAYQDAVIVAIYLIADGLPTIEFGQMIALLRNNPSFIAANGPDYLKDDPFERKDIKP